MSICFGWSVCHYFLKKTRKHHFQLPIGPNVLSQIWKNKLTINKERVLEFCTPCCVVGCWRQSYTRCYITTTRRASRPRPHSSPPPTLLPRAQLGNLIKGWRRYIYNRKDELIQFKMCCSTTSIERHVLSQSVKCRRGAPPVAPLPPAARMQRLETLCKPVLWSYITVCVRGRENNFRSRASPADSRKGGGGL